MKREPLNILTIALAVLALVAGLSRSAPVPVPRPCLRDGTYLIACYANQGDDSFYAYLLLSDGTSYAGSWRGRWVYRSQTNTLTIHEHNIYEPGKERTFTLTRKQFKRW